MTGAPGFAPQVSPPGLNVIGVVTWNPACATNCPPVGKPEVLYTGGEYCPFCGAERWALTAALSRFGTSTGLNLIHSSPTDVYPSTPMLSFHQSGLHEQVRILHPGGMVREADDASTPLGHVYMEQPTAQEAALFRKYANASIPFADIGNQYLAQQAQSLPPRRAA